jgi:hypothetical protein
MEWVDYVCGNDRRSTENKGIEPDAHPYSQDKFNKLPNFDT